MTAASMPEVDVVILSWGRIPDTCAAIDSALTQHGVSVRVIVIDQGSESSELDVLKAHCATRERTVLVCNGHNKGVPGGRNQGTALGDAAHVVALDNDAEFASPHELQRAVAAFAADPGLGVLAFRIKLFSADSDDRSSWPYPKPIEINAGKRFETDRFVGAGHMIRRSAFDAIGGYDDRFVFMHEEFDLSYRIINHGYRIVYDPSVVIRHKVSAERRVSWSGNRYYYNVRNKIYIAAKYNFNVLSSSFDIYLAVTRGLRDGYVSGTLRGIAGGLRQVPRGLRQRWSNPATRLSPHTKAYIRAAYGAEGLSVPGRIARRLNFAFGKKRAG